MKNLIITAAAALLVMTMTMYQLQYTELIRQKTDLKQISDEAAAAAALCIDEREFGEGFFRFDREEAAKKAEDMITDNFAGDQSKLRWTIGFDDTSQRPAVTVRIVYGELEVETVYEYLPLLS